MNPFITPAAPPPATSLPGYAALLASTGGCFVSDADNRTSTTSASHSVDMAVVLPSPLPQYDESPTLSYPDCLHTHQSPVQDCLLLHILLPWLQYQLLLAFYSLFIFSLPHVSPPHCLSCSFLTLLQLPFSEESIILSQSRSVVTRI